MEGLEAAGGEPAEVRGPSGLEPGSWTTLLRSRESSVMFLEHMAGVLLCARHGARCLQASPGNSK